MNELRKIPHTNDVFLRKLARFVFHNAPILIIFFGILVRIPFLLLPAEDGFPHTAWRQTDTASIAHNFLDNDLHILYPQIHWGGNGPGYVETEFQLFPYIVAVLYSVFGEHVWIGLFVSLLFSTGTFFVFYLLAKRLVQRSAAIAALAYFVFAPMNLRYSVVFMPEPTALFFYISALFLFHKWIAQEKLSLLILAALSTSLAILVKPTTIHIGLIFMFMLLYKYRLRAFAKWRVWLFAIITLLPGILWYLHARDLYLEYGNTFGIISGGDDKFNNLDYWFAPSFYYSVAVIDIKWVFGVAGLIPFVIGVVATVKKRGPVLIVYGLITQIIYYLLIPRYISFAIYYHIFAVPFVSLAIGIGIVWLWIDFGNLVRRWQPRIPVYLPQLSNVLIMVIFTAITIKFYFNSMAPTDTDFWKCAKYVDEIVPEHSRIIVSTTELSYDRNVPNNFEQPDLFFYSHRYGWSLPADRHTTEQLHLLFDRGAEYLIFVDHRPLYENKELQKYLKEHLQQIGPGPEHDCSIYRLAPFH